MDLQTAYFDYLICSRNAKLPKTSGMLFLGSNSFILPRSFKAFQSSVWCYLLTFFILFPFFYFLPFCHAFAHIKCPRYLRFYLLITASSEQSVSFGPWLTDSCSWWNIQRPSPNNLMFYTFSMFCWNSDSLTLAQSLFCYDTNSFTFCFTMLENNKTWKHDVGTKQDNTIWFLYGRGNG